MTAGAAQWRSVLDADRASTAIAIARDVALRAVDQETTAKALMMSGEQTQFRRAFNWQPHSLAHGDAGIAVMCSYLQRCHPLEEWDVIGHDLLTCGVRALEREPALGAAMFGGVSGFAYAVCSLSRDGTRYQRLLAGLDRELHWRTVDLVSGLTRSTSGVGVGQFDIISGLAGIGTYLLERDSQEQLPQILAALAWLAEDAGGTPRWHTPAERLEVELRGRFPAGNLNCGLAHGIPGPLAVLALASLCGHQIDGQAEAIRRVADWLLEQTLIDDWGVTWPTAAAVESAGDRAARVPARNAWCYGSPGLTRALWLAGEALDDSSIRAAAVEGIRAVLRRPVFRRGIDSPTFCHGVAGLLQIVLRFAHDTGLADLREGAADLADQLIAAYQPDRLLGYTSLEHGAVQVDRPGLLDGAPGVAMALLAAATDVEPTWDRIFALS